MQPLELAQKLVAQFGELLSVPVEFREEITMVLSDADRIIEVCSFAKTSLGFDYLVDISSVDNFGDDPRFTIVYELYGLAHGCHLRLKRMWVRKNPSCQRSRPSGARPIGTSGKSST